MYNWYVSSLKRNHETLKKVAIRRLTPYAYQKLHGKGGIIERSKNVKIKPYTTCNQRIAWCITKHKDGTQTEHEVRLDSFECNCNIPFETLMPCKHMVAVIRLINQKRPLETRLCARLQLPVSASRLPAVSFLINVHVW